MLEIARVSSRVEVGQVKILHSGPGRINSVPFHMDFLFVLGLKPRINVARAVRAADDVQQFLVGVGKYPVKVARHRRLALRPVFRWRNSHGHFCKTPGFVQKNRSCITGPSGTNKGVIQFLNTSLKSAGVNFYGDQRVHVICTTL